MYTMQYLGAEYDRHKTEKKTLHVSDLIEFNKSAEDFGWDENDLESNRLIS